MMDVVLSGSLSERCAKRYNGKAAEALYREYLQGNDSLKSKVYEAYLPLVRIVGPAKAFKQGRMNDYDVDDMLQMLAIHLLDVLDRDYPKASLEERIALGGAFVSHRLWSYAKSVFFKNRKESYSRIFDSKGREIPRAPIPDHRDTINTIFLAETVYELPNMVLEATRFRGNYKHACFWVALRIIEDREVPKPAEIGFWFGISSRVERKFIRDHTLVRLRIALDHLREQNPGAIDRIEEFKDFSLWFGNE